MKLGVGNYTESETRVVQKYMTSEWNQMTSRTGVRIGEGVPGNSDSGFRKSDSESMVTGARDRDRGSDKEATCICVVLFRPPTR